MDRKFHVRDGKEVFDVSGQVQEIEKYSEDELWRKYQLSLNELEKQNFLYQKQPQQIVQIVRVA